MPHRVPSLGYQVESPNGRRLFYSGDTTAGLSQAWGAINPHLMAIEVTWPNRMQDRAMGRHLTPAMLRRELEAYAAQKGALPRVLAVHLNPECEAEPRALQADITPAEEGMVLEV